MDPTLNSTTDAARAVLRLVQVRQGIPAPPALTVLQGSHGVLVLNLL